MTFLYCPKRVRIGPVVFFYSHNKIKRTLWGNGASKIVLKEATVCSEIWSVKLIFKPDIKYSLTLKGLYIKHLYCLIKILLL